MPRLQMHHTATLYGTGEGTHGFKHARQELRHQGHIPALLVLYTSSAIHIEHEYLCYTKTRGRVTLTRTRLSVIIVAGPDNLRILESTDLQQWMLPKNLTPSTLTEHELCCRSCEPDTKDEQGAVLASADSVHLTALT